MNRYSPEMETGGVATFLRVRFENQLGSPCDDWGKRHVMTEGRGM
jgi:hypothetical protein